MNRSIEMELKKTVTVSPLHTKHFALHIVCRSTHNFSPSVA